MSLDLVLGGTLEDRRGKRHVELATGPAQVGLEDLTDVHSGRNAERVEDDLHGGAVGQEGQVFLGKHLRDHTLVAVAAGHLVTDLKLALHGDEDLDLLDHAGLEVVSLAQPLDPLLVDLVEDLDLRLGLADDQPHLVEQRRGLERKTEQVFALEVDAAPRR